MLHTPTMYLGTSLLLMMECSVSLLCRIAGPIVNNDSVSGPIVYTGGVSIQIQMVSQFHAAWK